jgi:hypothetical protein
LGLKQRFRDKWSRTTVEEARRREGSRRSYVEQRKDPMGLGLGITLIVLGLIFVTGVIEYDINFLEDQTLGWILLAAGVLTIALGLVMNQQRNRTRHVEEHHVDRRV